MYTADCIVIYLEIFIISPIGRVVRWWAGFHHDLSGKHRDLGGAKRRRVNADEASKHEAKSDNKNDND